jgi:hypothetical protein
VTVAGVRLRMPVSALQAEWPDLALDEENMRIAKAAPFPLDFIYYKTTRDGVQIEITAQAGLVHGIGLVTPGWISDTAKAMRASS